MRYLSLLIGLLSVCITITSQAQNLKTLDDPNIEVRIFSDRVQITNTSPVDVTVFYCTVLIGQRANNRCPQPMCGAFIENSARKPRPLGRGGSAASLTLSDYMVHYYTHRTWSQEHTQRRLPDRLPCRLDSEVPEESAHGTCRRQAGGISRGRGTFLPVSK